MDLAVSQLSEDHPCGVSSSYKKCSFWLSRVDDCRKIHPVAPMDTVLSPAAIISTNAITDDCMPYMCEQFARLFHAPTLPSVFYIINMWYWHYS